MITKYNVKDLPRFLYGGTYSYFNFELDLDFRPMSLYLTEAESGKNYVITGLDDIDHARTTNMVQNRHTVVCGYSENINPYLFYKPNKPKKELRTRIEAMHEYYENKLSKICEKHAEEMYDMENCFTAERFELFLASITVHPEPNEYHVFHDTQYAKEHYGVDIKVKESKNV